jgi:SAM-dependent methyltransferase
MSDLEFIPLLNCVACNEIISEVTLDLGNQPLANDFLETATGFEIYPLKLMRCGKCFHSQLSIAVNPSRLFRNYSYISGTSETLSKYFDFMVKKIISDFGPTGKILDIGSNDGSFLSKFIKTNWNGFGVDPAVNLIPISISKGVLTLPTFFNQKTAQLLAPDYDAVVAMNIFAHTDNPLEILLGIKECLKESGRAYIQTSQAEMFFTGEFDTVYHEHISFFNVKSMRALIERAGLYLDKVSIVPIHGGSYLWEITKKPPITPQYSREEYEDQHGLYSNGIYENFAKIATGRVSDVQKIIENYRANKFTIVTYGAAAKGNTFLNFANIKLDYIFDDTPQKIGRYSPAGGCVVSSPNSLQDIKDPTLIIIPAWNFKSEILNKIRNLRSNTKDQYLTYFPEISQESI